MSKVPTRSKQAKLDQTLIVAGFHRSGTSLATRLLHRSGLFVGDDLLGAMPSNPYGHFEDREIVSVHDAILSDNGHNWQVADRLIPYLATDRWDQIKAIAKARTMRYRTWGFKDPRVCHFLPVWKHVLPNARVLIVYRHWADSTYSLERRHSREYFADIGPVDRHRRFWDEPDLALRMWVSHNRALVDFAHAHPEDVIAIPFSALARGFPVVRALNERWGLRLRDIPTTEVFELEATQGRPGRQPISDPSLIGETRRVWRELSELWEVEGSRAA